MKYLYSIVTLLFFWLNGVSQKNGVYQLYKTDIVEINKNARSLLKSYSGAYETISDSNVTASTLLSTLKNNSTISTKELEVNDPIGILYGVENSVKIENYLLKIKKSTQDFTLKYDSVTFDNYLCCDSNFVTLFLKAVEISTYIDMTQGQEGIGKQTSHRYNVTVSFVAEARNKIVEYSTMKISEITKEKNRSNFTCKNCAEFPDPQIVISEQPDSLILFNNRIRTTGTIPIKANIEGLKGERLEYSLWRRKLGEGNFIKTDSLIDISNDNFSKYEYYYRLRSNNPHLEPSTIFSDTVKLSLVSDSPCEFKPPTVPKLFAHFPYKSYIINSTEDAFVKELTKGKKKRYYYHSLNANLTDIGYDECDSYKLFSHANVRKRNTFNKVAFAGSIVALTAGSIYSAKFAFVDLNNYNNATDGSYIGYRNTLKTDQTIILTSFATAIILGTFDYFLFSRAKK